MDGSALDFPIEDHAEPLPEVKPAHPAVVHVKEAKPEPSSAVVDASGRIEDLPIAEKLMLEGDRAGDRAPVEQYRRLAARLLLAQAEHGIRSVMVTSALPGEGKTLTAANLALTLSESYKRQVLLVDADLRRPCVHQIFQVPNATGLNDGLKPDADRKVPLLQFSEQLTLLTAGRPDPDPMSVLSGTRMKRVLAEAKDRFEWVLIDTPPITLLTDAHLLSAIVDAVVLVVRAGVTPLPAIKKAVEAVGQERILGIVLNHAEMNQMPNSYSYYYSESSGT
jgi:capsular exopolysaccharide synthesis family protein